MITSQRFTRDAAGRACIRRLLLACALVCLGAGTTRAGDPLPWSTPDDADETTLRELAGRDGALLDLWFDLDVRHDEKRDGFFGSVITGREIWLRDSSDLEKYARVVRWESPVYRSRKLRVTVLPTDGRKPRRYDDGDLTWRGFVDAAGGVVVLDGKIESAVLTGLRVGDRIRIVEHDELHGRHGMPVLPLRHDDESWVRARARIRVPDDQELGFGLVGADSLANEVRSEQLTLDGRHIGNWTLADPRGTDWARFGAPRSEITLVPHVARPGEKPSFSAAPTWQQAAAAFYARIDERLVVTDEIEDLARRIVADCNDRQEMIEALYEHVQDSTRYLGLYSGDAGIIPAPIDETRQLGYGDCKGLATYLIGLCRTVGIEAWPVLVLTRTAGRIEPDQPNMTQFNHMIAWVNEGEGGCWLDPTLEGCPAGVVSTSDAASPVLMIRPDSPGLIEIPRTAWEPGCRTYVVDGAIDENLHLRVKIALLATGPGGKRLNAHVSGLAESDRDDAGRRILLSDASALQPDGHLLPSDSDAADWTLDAQTDRPLTSAGDRAFLRATIPPLAPLRWRLSANRSDMDLRRYSDRVERWTLELPAGWKIAAADSFEIRGDDFVWKRHIAQENGALSLHRELTWSGALLTGDRADRLRRQLADAVAREKPPIILEKESP